MGPRACLDGRDISSPPGSFPDRPVLSIPTELPGPLLVKYINTYSQQINTITHKNKLEYAQLKFFIHILA